MQETLEQEMTEQEMTAQHATAQHAAAQHTAAQDQPVAVEIYDQVYTLRGTDAAYIEHLAEMVDAKMRAVAEHGNTVDSLRVAVLACLNIADELVCLRERFNRLSAASQNDHSLRSRSASLSGMLDAVLDELDMPVRRAG